jgi:hypothetical protein
MFATWLYVSTSLLGENADAEIVSIRSIAELRNPELGLTGVLSFSGHHFVTPRTTTTQRNQLTTWTNS